MSDAPRFRLPTAAALGWLVGAASVGGTIAGYVAKYATGVADTQQATRHAVEFEASVDKRINEHTARMDANDRDRDTRTLTINQRVDGLAQTLHGRIDELTRREDQRNEQRIDSMNVMGQRVLSVEIKLCALGGVRISGCK